ncbi:hypothetical protein HORIV_01340 [Vreelandella olivaria]|uniref:Methyl-accepting transducer domain-containing protein n=1 Tax=Vreelandella olivaria TaxID=390919 RepID=A0ABM7G9X3_9GAMM|nr:hypothetical protein HORIV_01340 [Halomonas olivaria]
MIDGSNHEVSAGASLVTKAEAAISEVAEAARSVTQIMHEISAASEEQSHGIAQVNQAVAEMDQGTQRNAVGSGNRTCGGFLGEAGRATSAVSGSISIKQSRGATSASRYSNQARCSTA